ncbi:MAG TPA: frataxin family protein [Bryobacteraceae bacterium]|nr:frataxin family protein [Bryobacteraceae bacterium]
MDSQEFRVRADDALAHLHRRLMIAGDRYGFEADLNGGALAIEFDEPKAKFVVSPNAPVSQIWVSALSKSFKLDWDAAREAFALAGGPTLTELVAQSATELLGEEVSL